MAGQVRRPFRRRWRECGAKTALFKKVPQNRTEIGGTSSGMTLGITSAKTLGIMLGNIFIKLYKYFVI